MMIQMLKNPRDPWKTFQTGFYKTATMLRVTSPEHARLE